MNQTLLNYFSWILFLSLSLFPYRALAASLPDLHESMRIEALSLEQALTIADENNKDIQKAREYSQWIQGKYLEERAQALPQVSFLGKQRRDYLHQDYSGTRNSDPLNLFSPGTKSLTTNTTSFDVSVTQPLYTWGKLSAAIRAATVALSTSDQQLRLYRQATRRDVTAAFHDVLLAKELHAIAQASLAQKEAHLEEAKKKLSLGTATDYDVLAAEVSVRNARPEVIRAENTIRLARIRLQFLLGKEKGEVDATGNLKVSPEPVPVYEAALAVAFERRPEILNQGITLTINEELVTIAKAGDKPYLYFSGGYTRGFQYYDSNDNDIDGTDWSASIILSWPFFDGFRTKGQVVQAKSNLESSRIDLAKLKETISLQIQAALDLVKEAREILEALEGTVQQAERLLSMAEKGFEYGVKTFLDVEDAQLNLSTSRGNRARASRDYLVALTNLKWVQGVLGEE